MTPNALAAELGVPGLSVRKWLRARYPRDQAAKGERWELSPELEAAARAEFAARRERLQGPPPGVYDPERRWFWEGNVQATMARYLEGEGWAIEHLADTRRKAPGDDIRARRDGIVLRVEVKGWPSDVYADPRRAGERKPTRPSTQAHHWYAEALLKVARLLNRYPDDPVAIAVPDWTSFRRLIALTAAPLSRLGVTVYLVAEDESVEVGLDNP